MRCAARVGPGRNDAEALALENRQGNQSEVQDDVANVVSVVAASDWVIDIGPGAGDEGGRVVAAGLPAEIAQHDLSRTAPYLARALQDHR
jgi:hypothetical protein